MRSVVDSAVSIVEFVVPLDDHADKVGDEETSVSRQTSVESTGFSASQGSLGSLDLPLSQGTLQAVQNEVHDLVGFATSTGVLTGPAFGGNENPTAFNRSGSSVGSDIHLKPKNKWMNMSEVISESCAEGENRQEVSAASSGTTSNGRVLYAVKTEPVSASQTSVSLLRHRSPIGKRLPGEDFDEEQETDEEAEGANPAMAKPASAEPAVDRSPAFQGHPKSGFFANESCLTGAVSNVALPTLVHNDDGAIHFSEVPSFPVSSDCVFRSHNHSDKTLPSFDLALNCLTNNPAVLDNQACAATSKKTQRHAADDDVASSERGFGLERENCTGEDLPAFLLRQSSSTIRELRPFFQFPETTASANFCSFVAVAQEEPQTSYSWHNSSTLPPSQQKPDMQQQASDVLGRPKAADESNNVQSSSRIVWSGGAVAPSFSLPMSAPAAAAALPMEMAVESRNGLRPMASILAATTTKSLEKPTSQPRKVSFGSEPTTPAPGACSPSSGGQVPDFPNNNNYGGEFNFRIAFTKANEAESKKTISYVYSEHLNKLYVSMKRTCPVHFLISGTPPRGSLIRAMATYSRPQDLGEPVRRCMNHATEDKDDPEREHFVRCQNPGSQHVVDDATNRYSVHFSCETPPVGCDFLVGLYQFTCFSSCTGTINRRPTQLVFTLEHNGVVLGRQVVDLRICACPGRDKASDEGIREQRKHKISDARSLNGPSSLEKTPKRSKQEDAEEIFTIEVRGLENYEMVKSIVDKLEMARRYSELVSSETGALNSRAGQHSNQQQAIPDIQLDRGPLSAPPALTPPGTVTTPPLIALPSQQHAASSAGLGGPRFGQSYHSPVSVELAAAILAHQQQQQAASNGAGIRPTSNSSTSSSSTNGAGYDGAASSSACLMRSADSSDGQLLAAKLAKNAEVFNWVQVQAACNQNQTDRDRVLNNLPGLLAVSTAADEERLECLRQLAVAENNHRHQQQQLNAAALQNQLFFGQNYELNASALSSALSLQSLKALQPQQHQQQANAAQLGGSSSVAGSLSSSLCLPLLNLRADSVLSKARSSAL